MTAIAAAYDGPDSYALAADSYAEVNCLRIPRRKIHQIGAHLIGGTGLMVESDRVAAALGALVVTPTTTARTLLEVAWSTLTANRKDDNPKTETCFVCVGPDGVWILGTDGCIGPAPNRWAVGAGEDICIGAMHQRPGSPAEVVRLAVEAACLYRAGCFGEPVVLVNSTKP